MYDCWDEVEGQPVSVSLSILCDETSSSDLRDEPGPSDRPVKLFKTHISQSRSYTYRPAPGELSQTQCEQLASALKRITFTLEELDLSRNSVKESGAELLFAALKSSNCKVTTLRLSDCILSERCLDSLVSVRKSYHLMELDLSGNKYLRDSGVKLLSDGLRNRYCRLRTLRLNSCNLSENSCGYLASAIKSSLCFLEELDLSLNKLQDSGIKLLSDGLKSQFCKLKTLRLVNCLISDEGCVALVSALQSKHSDLTELDLSGNELQDQGMKLLSALVESPDCKLKTLRVEEGLNLITMDRAKTYFTAHSATQSAQRQTEPFTTPDELLKEQRQFEETTRSVSGERTLHKSAAYDTMADFTRKRHSPQTVPSELWKTGSTELQKMEEKLQPQSGSLPTSSSDLQVNLFKTGISQSRSYTYRPAPGELSQTQCEQLASALKRITFTLEELDLSRNSVKESGAELLFAALESSNCKVTTLRLSDCILSKTSLDSLVSVLNADHLMELDLSGNKYLRDSGVKLLSDGLRNRYGRLRTLRLSSCNLSENSCGYLASAIKSRPDCVEELDLSLNNLQDSGIKLLSDGLKSPYCELKTLRLNSCNLSENSCGFLASAIKSNPYCVEELDLSLNKLQDSGIKLLSDGLKSQYCKLKTLRLVNCLISDEGCAALVSALQSKHSDLTELDLSGNELQDQGMNLLFALVESPDCKLKTLRVKEGRNLIIMDSPETYFTAHSATHSAQRQTEPFTTPDELLKEQRQFEETTRSVSGERTLHKSAAYDTMADFTRKRHSPQTVPSELWKTGSTELQKMEEKLQPQFGSLSTSSSDLHDEPGPSKRLVNLFKTGISQRRSYTYRPAPGELSQTQCEQLASALRRITFTLEELDLSRNSVKESGAELLFAALESSNCKVTTLRLSDCILSKRCLDSLVSVLKSYHLMELDLSGNKYLRDSGVKLLSDGLRNRYFGLRTLRLSSCNLSENSCGYLASAMKSRFHFLKELDLSLNKLQDSGIKLLSDVLKSPYCKLIILRLSSCNLSENSCGYLASAIKSRPYCFEELDLSLNKLQDSGIKLLSDGLKSQLVNCLISDEGCAALVSALQSKPSDLTELDLSGNELQDQGMNLLFALVESPDCKLKMLRSVNVSQC
ncbi:uncharacterized protein LOC113161767 [Anabas testudineus]|uniref:uncharacterized protein LOC113161767 n=1 Tax=Anabas testudineus TaxID=64144 RepID=UPI000E45F084|nr:uncharacterized protein LOC113161767 [Anabas testudineus]